MRQTHCDFEGCVQPHRSNGLCAGHYSQQRRNVQLRPLRSRYSLAEDLDSLKGGLEVQGDGCWVWTGTLTGDGYGVVSYNRVQVRVHRRMYELAVGPIPDGAVVHHKCANRACARPEHLQAISQTNNVAEMHERAWYVRRIAELEAQLEACRCGDAA